VGVLLQMSTADKRSRGLWIWDTVIYHLFKFIEQENIKNISNILDIECT
jgi:hypothetical protein